MVFHVFLVRQAEVFLERDVTKHRAAIPADHRRTNRAGDVVVTRGNVSCQRPKRVERRFVTPFKLFRHVLFNHVDGNVTRPFIHHLHAMRPRAFGQFTLS